MRLDVLKTDLAEFPADNPDAEYVLDGGFEGLMIEAAKHDRAVADSRMKQHAEPTLPAWERSPVKSQRAAW